VQLCTQKYITTAKGGCICTPLTPPKSATDVLVKFGYSIKCELLEAFCSLSSTEMRLNLYFQVLCAERQLLRWPRFTFNGQEVDD